MRLLLQLSYPFRLLWYSILFYEPTCKATYCARPIVGFSMWCRHHTDQIFRAKHFTHLSKRRDV